MFGRRQGDNNRRGGRGQQGGGATAPSSAQNWPASGTPIITAPSWAVTAANNSTITTAPTPTPTPAFLSTNNTAPTTATTALGSEHREVSQRDRAATPRFLAPPRRHARSDAWGRNRAMDFDDPARLTAMRKAFTSGADKVLAKPAPKMNVTVHVSLPLPMHGFKEVDPSNIEVAALLSGIAKEHDATAEATEVGSAVAVTVNAANRAQAQKVIAVLRDQLLYQPGEESVWRARLLVHPPKVGKDSFTAVLPAKEGASGRRVTAASSVGAGSASAAEHAAAETGYKAELAQVLDHAARILRNTAVGMSMKIHFGSLVLKEWKKDKAEYQLAEVESLVHRAGMRGTAQMLNKVSEAAARALIARLSPENQELPESVRGFLESGDPERAFSLIMDTKNLHVESTFETMQAQKAFGGGVQQPKRYAPGPLTTHQVEKLSQAAEIVTLCPESGQDWAIEIRKKAAEQNAVALAPFNAEQLRQSLVFRGGALQDEFPEFAFRGGFISRNAIKAVRGRLSLKYMLGSRYMLEVDLFRNWDIRGSAWMPDLTAAVMLYSDDWDAEDLRAGVATPREWASSFSEQFLQQKLFDKAPEPVPGTTTEPMDFLLLWIDWILKALDGEPRASEETM